MQGGDFLKKLQITNNIFQIVICLGFVIWFLVLIFMSLLSQIESILFVASKPLSNKAVAKTLRIDISKVEDALETLKLKYNQPESGIHILFDDEAVQMATNPDNATAIDSFVKDEISGELTRPQLETLTVAAYRGPITRPELEQIRGVNCALILRNLMVRGLVEESDDAEKLMPVYRLTFDALRHLGVTSVAELPEYQVLNKHENIEQTLRVSE